MMIREIKDDEDGYGQTSIITVLPRHESVNQRIVSGSYLGFDGKTTRNRRTEEQKRCLQYCHVKSGLWRLCHPWRIRYSPLRKAV